ncbi:hypothetical protein Q7P37_011617 [Cladosporium fusiforme]
MPRKYHALKVPKARQDWSKYNLYNLQRLRAPWVASKTFFQQKWEAKAAARAYHNPYVREGQWTRMFDRRLPAVVPVDFKYLARSDGSEQATGRGMGLQKDEDSQTKGPLRGMRLAAKKRVHTPYMHMAFHPLERRLDTAIFRALFASSSKQARQFVVHGWVKVNGKKMTYPGYLLNPGDMFSVDPERVLFATGAGKAQKQSGGAKKAAAEGEEASEEAQEETSSEEAEVKESEAEVAEAEPATQESNVAITPEEAKKGLRTLMDRAKRITDAAKGDLSGRRLKDLRQLSKDVRKTMTKFGARNAATASMDATVEDLSKTLDEITLKIPAESLPFSKNPKLSPESTSSNPQAQDPAKEDAYKASKEASLLHQALQRARENPVDPSKPYATPWRPRDYMSAFAFIPRYLEVNQNICSAVYLRHPVARPGLAEVPTPLTAESMGLAFNWYLRRR